ncbi:FAD-dependent oxidoreductase [Henriciella sp. AS95]|uniref:FAD-dependent oxidoreductase n=1 Tax=Henriciella sp. AS95 TaxID=3135782 RepID=UPI00317CA01B
MPKRVAIIGGGPAGISLAKMLADKDAFQVTVFESENAPGGKSFSVVRGESIVEMGTCYLTRAHRIVTTWMNDADIHLARMNEQSFDGEDFLKYVRRGAGPPLPAQIISFLLGRWHLMRAVQQNPIPQWALEQAAQPVSEWLRARNLHKIERFMYRSLTNLGYGFVDETPTVQAMRWNDLDLILTGLFRQLKMPIEGWSAFWTRLSADLDVRLGHRASRIERTSQSATIHFENGEMFEADHVVCAMPIDDFVALTDSTPMEAEAASAITWNAYTTTLIGMKEKYADSRVEAYSRAVVPGAPYGRLMSARYEGYEPDLGGHLYLTGQLAGSYSDAELEEMLRADIADHGGAVDSFILQRTWKYFARYDSDAIRNGLLTTLKTMQGHRNTWYTGAAFSHEAVSNIVNFNAGLAAKIQATA